MFNLQQATDIVLENIPDGNIKGVLPYKDLYLFIVHSNVPYEEDMDSFYSVDKNTGAFNEFSIFTDGNASEILSLFRQRMNE